MNLRNTLPKVLRENHQKCTLARDIYGNLWGECRGLSKGCLSKLTMLSLIRSEGVNAKLIDDLLGIEPVCTDPYLQGNNALGVNAEKPRRLGKFKKAEGDV